MFKKVLSALLIAASLPGLLSGCNSTGTSQQESTVQTAVRDTTVQTTTPDSSKVYEVTFWYSMGGLGQQAIQTMVSKFNDSQKNIKVDAQFQGEYSDALNKLKSTLKGGKVPDIIQLGDDSTRWMVDSKAAVPIQDLIDAEKYDISAFEKNILAYYTVDGKLYSMPFNNSTPVLYYNKDMFKKAGLDPEKPPKNLDELIEYGKKLVIKDANGNMVQSACSIDDADINHWLFLEWLCMQGLNYADNDDGRTQRATAVEYDKNGGGLKILNKLKEVNQSGITNSAKKLNDIFGLFASGQSAMMIASTAGLNTVLTTVDKNFEVGTGFFPSISPDDKGGVSVGGASLWLMDTKDPAQEKAAFEFIKFMASPEEQVYWNGQTGYFPVTTKAYDLSEMQQRLKDNPQFKTAIDQMHASSPQFQGPLLSVLPELDKQYQDILTRVLAGEITPEEGIENAAKNANETIGKYNESNAQ